MLTHKNNSDTGALAIVVHIPYRWDDRHFWHRRKPTEALAVPLEGKGAVLALEPCIFLLASWRRETSRTRLLQILTQSRLCQRAENLWILTPCAWLPSCWRHVPLIGRMNAWLLARQIRNSLKHILPEAHRVASWFYRPEQIDLVGLAGEDCVVYECYDKYHTANAVLSIPGRSELVKRQDQELLAKTDLVFTTSEKLWEEKRRLHPDVHFFPNAADVDFFARTQAPETVTAQEIRGLPHPIIGYLGGINDHLDMNMLLHIAESKPCWTLLMAGALQNSNMSGSDVLQRLKNLSNVVFAGWLQDDVPDYFKEVDVCLIPYRKDAEFNQYRNPIKLYEYMAMGKPVVSTNIPSVRSHADIIYIADTKCEVVACIERATAEDSPEKIAERMRWAGENSWDRRAERMVTILQSKIAANRIRHPLENSSTIVSSQPEPSQHSFI